MAASDFDVRPTGAGRTRSRDAADLLMPADKSQCITTRHFGEHPLRLRTARWLDPRVDVIHSMPLDGAVTVWLALLGRDLT